MVAGEAHWTGLNQTELDPLYWAHTQQRSVREHLSWLCRPYVSAILFIELLLSNDYTTDDSCFTLLIIVICI